VNLGTVADVIDIEPLARLLNRQKSGQYAAQCVMGFAMVPAIVWLGGRAAVALLILLVLLSVATLRGQTGRMRTWARELRRSATRWRSWAFVAFVAVGAAFIAPEPFLFFIDLAFFGRPHWANQITEPPVALLLEAAGLPDWLALLLMVVCLMGWVGVVVGGLGRLRRHLAESSVEAQRRDTRPPVLLLRSFADDAVTVFPSLGLFLTKTGNTLEHVLEEKLRAYGPVIAIGRPGEHLPPLGAAREYVAGETWRERIGELIGQARLVVVVMGASEGLVFEYDQLAAHGAIDKIVLVIPPDDVGPLQERWERFVRHALVGRTIAPPPLQGVVVALFPDGQRPTYVVHPKRRAEADHYSLGLEAALHHRTARSASFTSGP